MKKGLLATTAVLALSVGPALAADMAPRMVTKAPPLETFSWAGVYVGAHGGYAWGSHNITDVTAPADNVSVDPSGALFGVQVGYNTYLNRNWVLGYELDLSGANLSDSGLAPSSWRTESKIDYLGTARARFGYATGHWLLYATGGAAWAHNKINATIATSTYYTRDQFQMGWTAGAGVEYAIDRNWSVKGEYLYADLGKNPQLTVGTFAQDTDLTLHMVRVGVNYRFDGSAPAAAAAPAYPVKARPMAVATWSGGYVGGHGGYAWNDVGATDPVLAQTDSIHADGGFVGLTTGYNWLLNPNWLVGLESETSFAWTDTAGRSVPSAYATSAEIKYFGSERARIGYVAGDWLLYGTGGLAWARVNYDIRPGVTAYDSTEHYQIGWTAGVGAEWMFAPLWSAKAEYLHADYGTYESRVLSLPAPRTVSVTSDTVKFGINYHGDILGSLFH